MVSEVVGLVDVGLRDDEQDVLALLHGDADDSERTSSILHRLACLLLGAVLFGGRVTSAAAAKAGRRFASWWWRPLDRIGDLIVGGVLCDSGHDCFIKFVGGVRANRFGLWCCLRVRRSGRE